MKLEKITSMGAEIVNNCTQENKISQAKLNIEEILDAENHLIKEIQKKEFKEGYSSLIKKNLPTRSKLLCLCPKLDSEGVTTADGQWTFAEFLPFNVRYPMILP